MDLATRCRELFQSLEREGFGGRFHAARSADGEPSTAALSAWSSAHHALVLRHLDGALALDELRTLYAACQTESGLVMLERPLAGERAEDALLVAPPIAAYAVARLARAGADVGDLLERATRQLDAIWGERLPPDTNLPVILHPAESATPDSPLFDAVVESDSPSERAAELANLARSAAACRFDPDRALRAGHAFVVEDPVFCGWLMLALEETRLAWEERRESAAARKLAIRSSMIAEAISERLWWEAEEVFAAYNRQREEPMTAITAGGLVPAASRALLEEDKARRAVERHLAPGGSTLWGARAISFNPIVRDRPTDVEFSAWRGNTASGATQFWAHLALVRSGRPSDARVARVQLEELIDQHGFFSAYDALSGKPRGTESTDPALVLEMASSEDERTP